MMLYPEIPIPPRSEHLWRYTPWRRIHPTKVADVPQSSVIKFSLGQDSEMEGSDEIGRSFIHSISNVCKEISLTNESKELDLRCGGHICAGELNIKSTGDSSLIIRLSGDSGWTGIRILGDVSGRLSVAVINDLSTDGHLLRCEDWVVNRDSALEFSTLSTGGFLVKSDIRIKLDQNGAEVRGGIASNGHGSRHDDHHVEIDHKIGHTQSSLVMHAACNDSSHSVGTGLLSIRDGADKSDAGQVFRNLLLSEKARAEAIPELEVLADDVKAAHGAASAPIDSNQLHYLQSRGLSGDEASSLIVEGFLMDAFRDIKNQDVIAALRTRLLVHLECLING
ncbi:MAG: SufD family Fe-S cluster assembly protein [Candidatus Poseidoniaceae archaeon]